MNRPDPSGARVVSLNEQGRLFTYDVPDPGPDVDVRTCKTCGETKPVEHFYGSHNRSVDGSPYYLTVCKPCSKSHRRLTHRALAVGLYGELWHRQEGRCALATCDAWYPVDGTGVRGRLHIDHDHQTGKIRGLLCPQHNLGLGHFHDEPRELAAAIAYLLPDNRAGFYALNAPGILATIRTNRGEQTP